MKKFSVTLTVGGCFECPFRETDANENYFCSVSEATDLFSARKVVKENTEKLTETCPYFKEAK
jgi:nitrogenase subunit NifH